MYPPIVVKKLIIKGANLRLAAGYTPGALKEFAQLAVQYNTDLAIDCSGLSPTAAKAIATIGGSRITLIF